MKEKDLSILICSDYQFIYNWMSFAAWYSVSKNLPQAKIAILTARNNINLQLYTWAKKIDAEFFAHRNVGKENKIPYLNKIYSLYVALKEGLVKQPLLVLDADMMAVRELSYLVINQLENCNFGTNRSTLNSMGSLWYFNNQPLEKFVETINTIKKMDISDHMDFLALNKVFGNPELIEDLCNETYETNATVFTHYRERCGNFSRREYEKGLAYPPFIDQLPLHASNMTVNERRVFSLWSKMHLAFETLSK